MVSKPWKPVSQTCQSYSPCRPDIALILYFKAMALLQSLAMWRAKGGVHAGDFVDRGAWGLECLILLSAMKLAAPQHVTLLRGNHESSTCTQLYGFRTELIRKYGAEVCFFVSLPSSQLP